MAVSCGLIIEALERLAPSSLALEWDNVGLLVGESNRAVNKALIALDATDQVVEEAVTKGADLIITHHPVIFHPVKRVTDQTVLGRRLLKLIKNNISVYSAHTNLDIANGGVNDVLFELLGLRDKEPMEQNGIGCTEEE